MKQQQTDQTAHIQSLMSKLPISKHFVGGLNSTINEAANDKGKAIALFIKLGLFAVIGYFSWVYVLPVLFAVTAKMLAVAAVGAGAIAAVFLVPLFVDKMRALAKKLKKEMINEDPFGELEKQEKGIVENLELARLAHGQIKKLEDEMRVEAQKNEKEAKAYQDKIVYNAKSAENLKAELTDMEKRMGETVAKGTDEYVNTNAELMKLLSSSQRIGAQLEQAQNFVMKYGSRAAIMQKMSHKLVMVEAMTEEKVLDFRATVKILKKDYEFASKSKEATDAAKKAMLFDKTWELEYALDAVTSTIANDIAQTSGNFKDLNSLTADGRFDMNSDEMFANLDKLANSITTGQNVTPSAKEYNRADYKLTQADKTASGGFGEIF